MNSAWDQIDELIARRDDRHPSAVSTDWIRPGEALARRPAPMARISLSRILPTLHTATRGGAPTGSVTTIVGGPDVAKTGVAMTIADEAEHQGFVVVHTTDDNGRESAEIRWGQMMGFDRTKLEGGEATELARFRAAFQTRNIWLPDPDLTGKDLAPINTLEHVTAEAKHRFAGQRIMLLVDSITAVHPDAESHDSPRGRVIATMKALRKAANNPGWLVIAPCQANRESFKHRTESKNTDPLTAGAESGSIEFGSDLLLYLSTDEEGIRARIAKNKPGAGRKPSFRIAWDKDRARASEPDAASFEAEAVKIAEEAREQFWREIEAIVKAMPGLPTSTIRARLKRRLTDVTLALQDMARLDPPRVRLTRKGNGYFWYAEDASQGTL